MAQKHVRLTLSANPLQRSLIEQFLKDGEVPFSTRDGPGPDVILGQMNPVGHLEFLVPEDRLQEAKDLLCAHGIACDVSERLLNRCLEEIVKPLLDTPAGDLSRLVRFVQINNKETVRALFEATLRFDGGRPLLENLLFQSAREGLTGPLTSLARTLGEGATESFAKRFHAEALGGEKATRLALLDVLPQFAAIPWRSAVLRDALLHDDFDVRDAASEALFTIREGDCGYDPEASPEEREAIVNEVLTDV